MKDDSQEFDRRTLMAGALGAAALGAMGSAAAQPPPGAPPGGPPARPTEPTLSTLMQMPSRLYRLEADVRDCEVTGKVPDGLERRVLPRRSRRAVSDGARQHSVRRRRPRQHVPHQGRPRELPQPLRAQRALSRAGESRPHPVPDVPQPGDGRPERQGLEPQHGEHAHHQSPELSARAERRQPARRR